MHLVSQTKKPVDVIQQISVADTVIFTADNSGCFHSYIGIFKFCKQKNGSRKLIYRTDGDWTTKLVTSKKYSAFISKYKASVNHFKKIDTDKPACTSTVEFDLSNKKKNSKFKNTTCEADYNPEMFLMELIK
jgi:hypothetical protein